MLFRSGLPGTKKEAVVVSAFCAIGVTLLAFCDVWVFGFWFLVFGFWLGTFLPCFQFTDFVLFYFISFLFLVFLYGTEQYHRKQFLLLSIFILIKVSHYLISISQVCSYGNGRTKICIILCGGATLTYICGNFYIFISFVYFYFGG